MYNYDKVSKTRRFFRKKDRRLWVPAAGGPEGRHRAPGHGENHPGRRADPWRGGGERPAEKEGNPQSGGQAAGHMIF